jgi:uncharacterized protein
MDKYQLGASNITYTHMLFFQDNNYDKSSFANIIALVALIAIIIIIIITLAVVLYFLFDKSAHAQYESIQNVNNNNNNSDSSSGGVRNNNSTLYARGTAQTMVQPDKVTLSLAVETTNKTANTALVANSDIMDNVLTALKAAGLKKNETSTSFFNISPNYNNTEQQVEKEFHPVEARNIISYTVTNSINIESFNLVNVSRWIDAAVAAGANSVNNIYFSLSDEKLRNTENILIKQALENARNKADIAASALGLKEVIGVKSINLNVGYPIPQPLLRQEALTAAAPSTPGSTPVTPIISGQQEVTTNVDVAFSIG